MKLSILVLCGLLLLPFKFANPQQDFVLTRDLLELFLMTSYTSQRNKSSDQFEFIAEFQTEKPADGTRPVDGVQLAWALGRCFVTFQPYLNNIQDVYANYAPGESNVCLTNATSPFDCCKVRTGMYNAYYASYYDKFMSKLHECMDRCSNPDECLVLTGKSQGAMVAYIAAIALKEYNPITVLYGPQPTVWEGCTAMDTTRVYRMLNTGYCKPLGFKDMFLYDFVWLVKSRGEIQYGHMVMLSDDPTGVAYIGLDKQDWPIPWIWQALGMSTHILKNTENQFWWASACRVDGYVDRWEKLLATYDARATPEGANGLPIRSTGYAAGNRCTRDFECASGRCVGYRSKGIWKVPGKCA